MSSSKASSTDPTDPNDPTDPTDPSEPDAADRNESDELAIYDEDLDAAAELFDGDDSDPLKFIEKSLHYQDMLMTKKQAEERVQFLDDFKKTMPSGKEPTAKMGEYKARLDRVTARMKAYEVDYAKKRVEACKQRKKRTQQAKEEKESYDQLPKRLKSAIVKTLQKRKLLASKAAMEAIAAMTSAEKEVSDDEKLEVGFAAFSKTFGCAFEGAKMDYEVEESPTEEV